MVQKGSRRNPAGLPRRLAADTQAYVGVSENTGYLILGSLNKDPTILGYYIRVPYFRKLQYDNSKPYLGLKEQALSGFCRLSRYGWYTGTKWEFPKMGDPNIVP